MNMTKLAAAILASALCTGAQAYDAKRAMDNLSGEMTECAVYWGLMSQAPNLTKVVTDKLKKNAEGFLKVAYHYTDSDVVHARVVDGVGRNGAANEI